MHHLYEQFVMKLFFFRNQEHVLNTNICNRLRFIVYNIGIINGSVFTMLTITLCKFIVYRTAIAAEMLVFPNSIVF